MSDLEFEKELFGNNSDDDEMLFDRKRIRNKHHLDSIPLEVIPHSRLKTDFHNKEIIFSVRVYKPTFTPQKANVSLHPSDDFLLSIPEEIRSIMHSKANMFVFSRYIQEMCLSGQNTLYDLRRLIQCPLDFMRLEDVSERILIERIPIRQPTMTTGGDPSDGKQKSLVGGGGGLKWIKVSVRGEDEVVDDVSVEDKNAEMCVELERDVYKNIRKRPIDFYPNPLDKTQNESGHNPGFFYINGCFYNHSIFGDVPYNNPQIRYHDSLNLADYSKPIVEWANKKLEKATQNEKSEIGPFKTSSMNVKLMNLKLRVGYPYVYVHRGNHEHLFVFHEVRLASDIDLQSNVKYPYVKSHQPPCPRICMICTREGSRSKAGSRLELAKWVTTHNTLTPEDPVFLCDACFANLNYDSSGNKIGSFKAYRYVDWNIL